jgi:hypothetical protein
MFRFMQKIIARVVAWGIKKLGGGFPEIKEQLLDYGISISEQPVRETVISTVNEADLIDKYEDISPDVGLASIAFSETNMKLKRNYVTKARVYWKISGVPEPRAEIISVLHDTNLTQREIESIIQRKLDKYALEYGEEKEATIVKTEIFSVLHKSGAEY